VSGAGVMAAALLGGALLAAGCEPTAPVRDCTGCTYDFADTIPPDVLVFHWPASRLPVRFYADPRGAMPALVSLGIAAWQAQFLYGEFRGVQVTDSGGADIIVQWEAGVPPDVAPDPGLPVAACDGATTNPTAVFTDSSANVLHVLLTPKGGSFTDAQVAACLRRVVIHELGHALGLLKHSPSPFDIMNQTPTVTLPSSADRRTVEVLYHTAATVVPPPR
jgi:predicted Zn-dependent protease